MPQISVTLYNLWAEYIELIMQECKMTRKHRKLQEGIIFLTKNDLIFYTTTSSETSCIRGSNKVMQDVNTLFVFLKHIIL